MDPNTTNQTTQNPVQPQVSNAGPVVTAVNQSAAVSSTPTFAEADTPASAAPDMTVTEQPAATEPVAPAAPFASVEPMATGTPAQAEQVVPVVPSEETFGGDITQTTPTV